MSNEQLQEAFYKVCEGATEPGRWYVCLMREEPRYGGPEEGGWWTSSTECVAYKLYADYDEAQAAHKAVQTLAKNMSEQAKADFGDKCLSEIEWCDQRLIDDYNYMGEVDGPVTYYVITSDSVPSPSYGQTHYE